MRKQIIKRWIEQGAEFTKLLGVRATARTSCITSSSRTRIGVTNQSTGSFSTDSRPKDWHRSKKRIDAHLIRRLVFGSDRAATDASADSRFPCRYVRPVPTNGSSIACWTSPQYGEHMTKYWLDLVRFADTNGVHHDHYREMTPYRDWLIRAFNRNLRL